MMVKQIIEKTLCHLAVGNQWDFNLNIMMKMTRIMNNKIKARKIHEESKRTKTMMTKTKMTIKMMTTTIKTKF